MELPIRQQTTNTSFERGHTFKQKTPSSKTIIETNIFIIPTASKPNSNVQNRRNQASFANVDGVDFQQTRNPKETPIRQSGILDSVHNQFFPRRLGILLPSGNTVGMDFQRTLRINQYVAIGPHLVVGIHHDSSVDSFQLVYARAIATSEHYIGLATSNDCGQR